eukprot:363441-Chlamydomonas_euryale.AAC.3
MRPHLRGHPLLHCHSSLTRACRAQGVDPAGWILQSCSAAGCRRMLRPRSSHGSTCGRHSATFAAIVAFIADATLEIAAVIAANAAAAAAADADVGTLVADWSTGRWCHELVIGVSELVVGGGAQVVVIGFGVAVVAGLVGVRDHRMGPPAAVTAQFGRKCYTSGFGGEDIADAAVISGGSAVAHPTGLC